MIIITTDRIKAMIANCKTETDVVSALRSHKVKYAFSTDTGYMAIRIPCKKGYIRIYRTCSRSVPFMVRHDSPVMYNPVPVLHPDY